MYNNIILNTDSYKTSMPSQYPTGTGTIFSYIESRGGVSEDTLFFGLQAFLKEYLAKPITMQDIDDAEQVITAHGIQFDRERWEYILTQHHGFLPVTIRAVKEGSIIPTRNVLVTIQNTDPNCFWVTTHLETALLRAVWYPTTVATVSMNIKRVIKAFMEQTCDTLDGLPFKLHDFGARGVSSYESAGLGGAAHLVNFMGTDTISGIIAATSYYNSGVCGFSIPASEHSISTSHSAVTPVTEKDKYGELPYIRRMLSFLSTNNLVAMVADSYDVYNFVDLLGSIKDEVVAATKEGKLVVVRPDSGDPVEVCAKVIMKLDGHFGSTVNKKGFRVLNNVRVIQGDGVNQESITAILSCIVSLGYSAENIAFGMGGALLQKSDRDTQRFAMKCSAAKINDEWYNVFKNPITDQGKASKTGRFTLWSNGTDYVTSNIQPENMVDVMHVVYSNGKLHNDQTFQEIRDRAAAAL